MREPPNYDEREQNRWRENVKDVQNRLLKKEKNIISKIATYIWRFGYSNDQVKNKIISDDMFAAWFAIEPRRQSHHENIAADWLRQEKLIANFQNLPASGPNAYYVTSDGEIRKGMKNPPGKSVDFYWKTGKYEIFAYHKYTKEGGGNQDSQFKEMVDVLKRFQGSAEISKSLFVIVDGLYYTERRMEKLQRFTRTSPPNSFACQIEEVPNLLENFA